MSKTDQELLKGCLNGKRSAQKALYEKYRVSLFGVCLRYANSRQEAEDMLQDGFIKIFGDLYQYRPIGPLGGWMRRVVVNVALQHIRRRKKLFPVIDMAQVADKYEAEEDIFSEFGKKELVKMIQQLPAGYRAVFNMYVIEGYSHQEIAEQLKVNINTSKSQLSRAKAALRKMLEKSMLDV